MTRLIPNLITTLRIAGAACILFCDVPSTAFWSMYLLCGISDMVDGVLARKLGAVTRTGALLDSVADMAFVACCVWMLIPALTLPSWLWILGGVIAAFKVINQIYSLARYKKCVFPHTKLNKVTGLLLFIAMPFSFHSIYPLAFVAGVAIITAVHEGYFIRRYGC